MGEYVSAPIVRNLEYKVYDNSGNELRGEADLTTTSSDRHLVHDLLATDDGGWHLFYRTNENGKWDVAYQKFEADGSPSSVTSTRELLNNPSYNALDPEATQLSDGRILVQWVSEGQDGSGRGIYARTLQSDGQLDSAPFRINTSTSGDQNVHGEGSVIALPDGGFVSFWGMNGSVYLQRFDSALNKVGSEQNVKPSDVSEQIDFNSATALDDGGFLVAYVVDNGDGEGNNAVFARQYDASVSPVA